MERLVAYRLEKLLRPVGREIRDKFASLRAPVRGAPFHVAVVVGLERIEIFLARRENARNAEDVRAVDRRRHGRGVCGAHALQVVRDRDGEGTGAAYVVEYGELVAVGDSPRVVERDRVPCIGAEKLALSRERRLLRAARITPGRRCARRAAFVEARALLGEELVLKRLKPLRDVIAVGKGPRGERPALRLFGQVRADNRRSVGALVVAHILVAARQLVRTGEFRSRGNRRKHVDRRKEGVKVLLADRHRAGRVVRARHGSFLRYRRNGLGKRRHEELAAVVVAPLAVDGARYP